MPGQSFPHVRTRTKLKRWYELNNGVRLAYDRALIAKHYPSLAYDVNNETGRVDLQGPLRFVAACGIPTPVMVFVHFPFDYPHTEPRAYDRDQQFPHIADRHFYPDGQCCLWLPPESRWNKDDPDALCAFLDEVTIFFDRQLVYDAEGSGIWPGPQRSHGSKGYIEFVLEFMNGDQALLMTLAPVLSNIITVGRNSVCPCGSGQKYKRCHLHLVETIARRLGPVTTRNVFRHWYGITKTDEEIVPNELNLII